jgi:CubicO group peptidase (beta-lactamase class C family)
VTAVVVAALLLGQHTSAQSLSLSLLERYLESLRVEAGIPGMSVSVLQDGDIIWERGFGRQDVEGSVSATPSTPYVIGDLSQTIGATLLLKKCVEQGTAELLHPLAWWAPQVPDSSTTIKDILTHTAPGVGFQYDVQRFAWVTGAIERCAEERPYVQVVVEELFERLVMARSVPGSAVTAFTPQEATALGPGRLEHYAGVLAQLAIPYRVDPRDSSVARTTVTPTAANAATGLVSTVRDLARFDAALDDAGVLLLPETRRLAWTRAWPQPTGLGWFVQAYNGEPIVWQFGLVRNAYSSLILKVPNRRLTVIALANSDGLSAPFALEQGDVTTSLFARLFLRLLVV